MESIAKCAGSNRIGELANRFVFVEYGDSHGDPVRTMSQEFGAESISMTHIVTRDFLPVYEVLAEAETRYDPRTVRKLRQSIYAIASHLDPSSNVVTSGYSKLDNLADDDRVIIGFSPLGEGFGRIPMAEDIYYDVVFDDHDFNVDLVVGDYLPKLLKSNSGGLPMHKYLRDSSLIMLDERIAEELGKRIAMDDYLNDQIKRSAVGWREQLRDRSVPGLIDAFGFEKAHSRLAALKPSEIDLDQLRAHLEQAIVRGGGKGVITGNVELKRAIRIYDFLKYGG